MVSRLLLLYILLCVVKDVKRAITDRERLESRRYNLIYGQLWVYLSHAQAMSRSCIDLATSFITHISAFIGPDGDRAVVSVHIPSLWVPRLGGCPDTTCISDPHNTDESHVGRSWSELLNPLSAYIRNIQNPCKNTAYWCHSMLLIDPKGLMKSINWLRNQSRTQAGKARQRRQYINVHNIRLSARGTGLVQWAQGL